MQKVTIIPPNQYRPKIIYFFLFSVIYKFLYYCLQKVLKWSLQLFRKEPFVDNITEFLPNTKYTDTYKE